MASLRLFSIAVCLAGCGLGVIPKALESQASVNAPAKEVYRFEYYSSDGSYRSEIGILLNHGTDEEELVIKGSYGFTEAGIQYITMFTADKNGYKPKVQQRVDMKYPPSQLPLPDLSQRFGGPEAELSPSINFKVCQSLCG